MVIAVWFLKEIESSTASMPSFIVGLHVFIDCSKVYKLKGGVQHYGNTVGDEGWKASLCCCSVIRLQPASWVFGFGFPAPRCRSAPTPSLYHRAAFLSSTAGTPWPLETKVLRPALCRAGWKLKNCILGCGPIVIQGQDTHTHTHMHLGLNHSGSRGMMISRSLGVLAEAAVVPRRTAVASDSIVLLGYTNQIITQKDPTESGYIVWLPTWHDVSSK